MMSGSHGPTEKVDHNLSLISMHHLFRLTLYNESTAKPRFQRKLNIVGKYTL